VAPQAARTRLRTTSRANKVDSDFFISSSIFQN
jgi:hypothetical protein